MSDGSTTCAKLKAAQEALEKLLDVKCDEKLKWAKEALKSLREVQDPLARMFAAGDISAHVYDRVSKDLQSASLITSNIVRNLEDTKCCVDKMAKEVICMIRQMKKSLDCRKYPAPEPEPEPVPEPTWLSYQLPENFNEYWTWNSVTPFWWAVAFDPETLSSYDGFSLTKIRNYWIDSNNLNLRIYQGVETNDDTLLLNLELNDKIPHFPPPPSFPPPPPANIMEVVLDEPIPIDVTKFLWIVIEWKGILPDQGVRPAASGPGVNEVPGSMITINQGNPWFTFVQFNLPFTWVLEAFVTNDITGESLKLTRK